jgi:DNA modification methylase
MISWMKECKRVIKDSGSIWVNLGDSYGTVSGNMKQGNVNNNKIKYSGSIENYTKPDNLSKCLMLIPHRFAIRCVDELGLILRNDIIWAKPNGMPESVTDRFSKKHEFFFFFVKSKKYYFDLDGVRGKHKPVSIERAKGIYNGSYANEKTTGLTPQLTKGNSDRFCNPNGKNPGDVADFWSITTKGSSEKHYATFNSELIDKPIVAGSPEGGIVLDPFAGTGTTLIRALELGRNVIGIEGKKEYSEIATKRIDKELLKIKLF